MSASSKPWEKYNPIFCIATIPVLECRDLIIGDSGGIDCHYPVYYTAALDAKIGQGDVGISGLSDMRNCDPILHEEPNNSRRVWAEGGGTRKGGDDHEGRARTQRQVLSIKEGQRKRSEGLTMKRREVLTKKE